MQLDATLMCLDVVVLSDLRFPSQLLRFQEDHHQIEESLTLEHIEGRRISKNIREVGVTLTLLQLIQGTVAFFHHGKRQHCHIGVHSWSVHFDKCAKH